MRELSVRSLLVVPVAGTSGHILGTLTLALTAEGNRRYDESDCAFAEELGRRAGTANFNGYSDALKQSGIVWDAQSLDRWITNPAGVAPGTTMPFAGLAEAQERATLVCYVTEKSK